MSPSPPRGPAAVLLAVALLAPSAHGQTDDRTVQSADGVLAPDRYEFRGTDGEADAVDARFPQDPERVRQLKAAARAVRAAEWDRAAEALLFILGEADGELVRLEDGASASVAGEAGRLLERFPARERRALERRLGPAARQALDRAVAAGDAAGLRAVAVQFPATAAARAARDRLAALHLDRGEPGPAARLFAAALADPDGDPAALADPRWRARAAAAFARSGDPGRARELWAAVAPADRAALGLGEPDPATGLPAALVGSAGRAGSPPAAPVEPLLAPRWTVPVVGDPAARADLAERVDRAERDGSILLPAARPLVVTPPGGPTLALTRTADGAVAVDAATGAVKWRTRASGRGRPAAGSSYDPFLDLDDSDEDPGAEAYGRFYRDAAFGTLTTDGTRAFLLEADPAAGDGRDYGSDDAEVVRLAAYRLNGGRLAWEVCGERRDEPFDPPLAGWRPLAPPTPDAGDLFLVAERLAADGRGRVALFCLDPATGLPRWDRTVAFADAALDEDGYRAEWGAFPAVAGGVVVVPTTVGWVAGVDRLTREVLWVSRVADAEQRRSGRGWIGGRRFGGRLGSAARERELPDYWFPGPPLVDAGPGRGRVFHAPPGGDRLYALDLLTGEPLWRPRRRQTWKAAAGLLPARLFAAGDGPVAAGIGGGEPRDGAASGGAVLLVGPRAVAAVAADDGSRRLWTWTLRTGDGRPAGLPRVAGDRVLVPLSGGVLVTLDAATGAELGRARRSDAGGRLGNLAAAGGRLLSLSPDGLTGFEDRAALAADLLAAAGGPPDPLLALREAELLRTEGATAAALAKLDAALAANPGSGPAPAGLSAEDAARFAALLRAALRDAVLGDDSGPPPPDRQDALLGRLAAAARTAPDRIAAARLRADRLAARGDGAAAVAALRDLIGGRLTGGAAGDDPLVPAATDGGPPPPAADPAGPAPDADAEVRLSRWVSRTLRTIREAGGDGRRAVDAFAADLLAGAGGRAAPGSPAAELLPFDPAVAAARLAWAEPRLAAGGPDVAAAEFALARLAVERGPAGGSAAVAEAAAALLRSQGESFGESPGDSAGVGGSYTLAVEAVASDVQVRPPVPLPAPAAARPFYRSHLLVPAADGARLDLLGPPAADGRRPAVGRFPLRGEVEAADPDDFGRARLLQMLGPAAAARVQRELNPFRPSRSGRRPAVGWVGGTAFVVANGAVTALHPETGTALWARTVAGAVPAGGAAALGVPATGAGGSARLVQVDRLARVPDSARPRSGVAAANEEVVLVLDGDDRTLTALDSRTGRTVWVRRRLAAADSAVLATASSVLLTPTSGRTGALALAARDGAPLPDPDRGANPGAETPLGGSAKAFAVAGAGVVRVVEREDLIGLGSWLGGGGPAFEVQCWDPATGAALWQRGLDGNAKLALLPGVGPPVAVEVRPDGRDADAEDDGFLRDLRTGAQTRLGGVNVGGSAVAVVADADRVALAAVRSGPVNRYASRESDGVAVASTVDLFARTGGRLWRAAAGGAVLIEDGFDRLPFVALLTADRPDDPGDLAEVEIAAFDKRTGREVFRTVIPAVSPAYDAAAELDGRALRLWNDGDESWRLSVVPAPEADAGEADDGEGRAAGDTDAAPAGEGEAGGELP